MSQTPNTPPPIRRRLSFPSGNLPRFSDSPSGVSPIGIPADILQRGMYGDESEWHSLSEDLPSTRLPSANLDSTNYDDAAVQQEFVFLYNADTMPAQLTFDGYDVVFLPITAENAFNYLSDYVIILDHGDLDVLAILHKDQWTGSFDDESNDIAAHLIIDMSLETLQDLNLQNKFSSQIGVITPSHWRPEQYERANVELADNLQTLAISDNFPVWDFIENESMPISKFIRQKAATSDPDEGNYDIVIALIGKDGKVKQSAAFTEEDFHMKLQNHELFYECKEETQRLVPLVSEVETQTAYIKLTLPNGSFYVPADQVREIANQEYPDNGVLVVGLKEVEPPKVLPFTTSVDSIDVTGVYTNHKNEQIDAMSADHCQADSNKHVYQLYMVDLKLPSLNGSLPPVLSPSPQIKRTPQHVRERRNEIYHQMNTARLAGDRNIIRTLAAELATLH